MHQWNERWGMLASKTLQHLQDMQLRLQTINARRLGSSPSLALASKRHEYLERSMYLKHNARAMQIEQQ
jgi:hypothetical protein